MINFWREDGAKEVRGGSRSLVRIALLLLSVFVTVADMRHAVITVGLCLREQVMPEGQILATEEWDWKVDAVAVGDGSLLTFGEFR